MNLRNIFRALSEFFKQENIEYGIIGAFALYAYGYVRATRDIDFVTRTKYQKKIITFLESLGFETTFSSNAFSNHLHPIDSVRVDIMYVEGITANNIFSATQDKLIFKGVRLPVVSVEHLVAMKLFAIQNNPERKFKDFADIKEILCHSTYNKEAVKEYFHKYGQEEYYEEIVKKNSKGK